MNTGSAVGTLLAFGLEAYRDEYVLPPVTPDDLPISWLLSSLIDYGDLGCDCC